MASRVTALLAREGFAGEVLVADRERVQVNEVAGGVPQRSTWRWASVSKQVAAALTMRQVQAGLVKLDEPVMGRLPAATAHPRITWRHLLMHTTGLEDIEVSDWPADPVGACLGKARQPPGERFEYRNCDTVLVARLLQQVTGRPYAQLLHEELTAAVGPHRVSIASSPPELAAYGAAGALTGTALDLLAFDRALLARRWLQAEYTQVMWTGEPALGYVALGAWAFEAPIRGCTQPVALVERRGAVRGVQVRNIMAPTLGKIVIVFTLAEDFEFGEVWQGQGFTHDLLSAALCG
ncbi:serine hydrolase [Ideonella sp. DXS29W]|uniref:Serine hydrolase n=1 Tax=Ideonella lacteola TaxID=2984193 RepID=A0ABU9BZB1_9BURK